MSLICPHCGRKNRPCYAKEKDDIFFCVFCSKRGIVESEECVRKMSSEEELDESISDKELASKDWLPMLKKEDICFDVVVLENGVFNPYSYENYSFLEAERFLELLFHQTGYVPQTSDDIWGYKKDEGKSSAEQERFYIVGKGFAYDEYETILLYVVSEEKWLEKSGY